jgi:hypothetical protein
VVRPALAGEKLERVPERRVEDSEAVAARARRPRQVDD